MCPNRLEGLVVSLLERIDAGRPAEHVEEVPVVGRGEGGGVAREKAGDDPGVVGAANDEALRRRSDGLVERSCAESERGGGGTGGKRRALDFVALEAPAPPVVLPPPARGVANAAPALLEPLALLPPGDNVGVHLARSETVWLDVLAPKVLRDHVVLADLSLLDAVVVKRSDAGGVEPET